ncbi:MAG: isoleucine--tRNA ligase [Proteobacteria bacterium]|nr:isoleucine--tRNA ligase [Pseudomonadota bacterium]
MKFSKPEAKVSFPAMEEKVLSFWDQNKIFEKSVDEKLEDQRWAFYDGPPFATGLPHYGHLLAGTIKDVVPRYYAMNGKKIIRRFGWDCHGLPIEFEVEKRLDLKGRKDILNFGVDKFNEECRSIVLRYTKEWEQTVRRMGRWIDFKNDYKTMDLNFMESVWSVFQKLWDKGLVYEDKKVLPYSTRVTTPLSNFEANLNYQDVQDPAVTAKLRLKDDPTTFILVWTTTPWTLPSNLATAVNPKYTYAKVKPEGSSESYILLEKLIPNIFKKQKVTVEKTFTGQELAGTRYEQLIPTFTGKLTPAMHQVYTADYVTDESGTGIVHLAPYGEEDFVVFKRVGIEPLEHLDEEGIVTNEAPLFEGLYFKDADKKIIQYLKDQQLLFAQETIMHSYPFCYRTDTPLIYRPISTWFVNVEKIKDQLLKNNAQTHWVPEHLKDGRFGKWLEGAKDWAISRNRFWGNPIPVWRNKETGEMICIGSKEELEKLSGQKVTDLHKHFIDKITIKSPKTGDTLTRVSEILDCWFESGSMPYAQVHYPFSVTDKEFDRMFPAEFIAEGLDQTRGWFYTLSVLSAALGKGPAFKNVVVNGIVLAEDGRKMSKRLQNYPDPNEVLNKYGADTLRIYLLQSGAVAGESLKFSEAGLQEMTRKVLLPLWNAYSFLATYASVDGWDPSTQFESKRTNELDEWILIKLDVLKARVHEEMCNFHLSKVIPPILDFIDDLTNWYIRRSRRRFWKSENDGDKNQAYSTLYEVLVEFCKIAAPFIPMVTEEIYQKLKLGSKHAEKLSVHLDNFPAAKKHSEAELNKMEAMDQVRNVVALGRELREKLKIKTRQPLATLYVGVVHNRQKAALTSMIPIMKEELNVRAIEFLPSSEMATWMVKPNFKLLGKTLGAKMKEFQGAVSKFTDAEVTQLLTGQSLNVMGDSYSHDSFLIELQANQEFHHSCHSAGSLVIAFDENLTDDLKAEGLTREFINRVQQFRKEIELNVEDRISLTVDASEECSAVFKKFESMISYETLSKVNYGKLPSGSKTAEDTIDGHKITFGIEKN